MELNNSNKIWTSVIDDMIKFYADAMKSSEKEFLINSFIEKNKKYNNIWNSHIHNKNSLRIMTYNVHFWTDIHEQENLDKILQTIKNIDPEIVCLQEFLYSDVVVDKLDKLDYHIITMCLVVPSWFNKPYGNCIIIKKNLLKRLQFLKKKDDYGNLCEPYSKCLLGQKIVSFPPKDSKKIGSNDDKKCYIKISLPYFDIFCIHLTAYDPTGTQRIKELNIINDDIKRSSLIMGDFNALSSDNDKISNIIDEYKKNNPQLVKILGLTFNEINHVITSLNWMDVFKIKSIVPPLYTNWTGFRVDYIFVAKWENMDTFVNIDNASTYFSSDSDHNPLFVDLKYTNLDEINKMNFDDVLFDILPLLGELRASR
jgi:endonuclease/exonuclease/phosphatase family metal-dependent hydrolase